MDWLADKVERREIGKLIPYVASCAATTEAPRGRESRRGRIPEEPLVLYGAGPMTLCSQKKSSPFWITLWLASAGRIIQ
jgi:hypothetical protein